MRIENLSDEQLLRNNLVIILASRHEGASFKDMEVFGYRDGLIKHLRALGYKIFLGFRGSFVIDDYIAWPVPRVSIDIDELVELEKVISGATKPGRI